MLMWRRKKRAAIAFALTAFTAGLIFACSGWTPALLPNLMGMVGSVSAVLGLFWMRTGTARVAFSCAGSILALMKTSVSCRGCVRGRSLPGCRVDGCPLRVGLEPLQWRLHMATALRSSLWSPTQAVFTARVVFACPLDRRSERRGTAVFARPGRDREVGDWAIGIVQERFWGMPRWTRLVLLTNYVYWEGETYFVDGRRDEGLLTQFLPIVEGGIGCSLHQARAGRHR